MINHAFCGGTSQQNRAVLVEVLLMARLNDDAQWIILMGFLISFSLFFLAIVINQSTVVGQTTAESVIEFPKNDIRDVRHVIGESVNLSSNSGIVKERY